MDQFKNRYGEWTLIAGAAEGIGAAFTTLLASRGMHIVMADNNLNTMQLLADKIRTEFRVEVRQIPVDLAGQQAADILLESTADLDCRLMVYVAAYSKVKPFLSDDKEELEKYLIVNNRTPMLLIHGFANRLKRNGKSGGLMLISSLAGLMGPPLVAPYAATKGFLIRLAESLSAEFKPLNIDINVCCAGLTSTPTYKENTPERTRSKTNPMSPNDVAACALHQLGKKVVSIPGRKNQFSYFLLLRLLPHSLSLKILDRTMRKMYESGKISNGF